MACLINDMTLENMLVAFSARKEYLRAKGAAHGAVLRTTEARVGTAGVKVVLRRGLSSIKVCRFDFTDLQLLGARV